jgi:flagellar export protein FliJ
MKAFRFPLQAVRTLRERQEQQALHAYAEALRQQQSADHALRRANDELHQACDQWQQTLNSRAAVEQIEQIRCFCAFASGQKTACLDRLEAARTQARRAWEHLVVCRRQRSAVDRYYEKLHAEFVRRVEEIEQKESDEMGQRCCRLSVLTREPPAWN